MTALLFPAFRERPQEAEDRRLLYAGDRIEFREAGGGMEISGVAIRYGVPSEAGRLAFREEFAPGAFTNLSDPAIYACASHKPDQVLGRQGAGTLRLEDSPAELRFSIDLPETSAGRDTAELARRGDLAGASISFIADTRAQEWSGPPEARHRLIRKARLLHLSPVLAPAHQTSLRVS